MSSISKIALIAVIVMGVDSSVRTLAKSEFVNQLPICSYLSWSVEGYANDECLTVTEITEKKRLERNKVEENITNNLLVLVPKRLEAGNVLSSPEILFIKERTGDSRINFRKTIDSLRDVLRDTPFTGQDSECSNYIFNEKGELEISCEFYGFGFEDSNSVSNTSRMTTFAFLDRLAKSDFKVINPPKSFSIAKFTSIEAGTKGTFTTVTKVNFKLRYSPNSNARP